MSRIGERTGFCPCTSCCGPPPPFSFLLSPHAIASRFISAMFSQDGRHDVGPGVFVDLGGSKLGAPSRP